MLQRNSTIRGHHLKQLKQFKAILAFEFGTLFANSLIPYPYD